MSIILSKPRSGNQKFYSCFFGPALGFIGLFLLTLFSPTSVFATIASCRADGAVDASGCLQTMMAISQQRGDAQVFVPNGTYLLTRTLIVPNKIQLIGNGRGDAHLIGTTLLAAPSFPAGSPLVQLGPAPGPNFGVHVENLTLDCAGHAGTGLLNNSSEELSYGKDLLIKNCPVAGLDVESYAAQNSGPFENLEIYPGTASAGAGPSTLCVKLQGVIAFRGLKGITCNFDPSAHANIGLQVDGGGYFEHVHVEQAKVGIQMGTTSISADGATVMNAQLGPNVLTGVLLTAPAGNTQNITLLGLSCVGCTHLLEDTEMQNTINDNSIGWYLLGNGANNTKTVLCSNYAVPQKVYSNVNTFNLGVGNGNNLQGTLTVWDSTPSGITSVIAQAGSGQGQSNLEEWRSAWGQAIASVDYVGKFHLPGLQLQSATAGAGCSEVLRGTVQFVPSSADGHDQLQVCARLSDGSIGWKSVF